MKISNRMSTSKVHFEAIVGVYKKAKALEFNCPNGLSMNTWLIGQMDFKLTFSSSVAKTSNSLQVGELPLNHRIKIQC